MPPTSTDQPHPSIDVTIVIATKNRLDTLRPAIASAVAQQPAERVEVLLLDDGSTDGTADAIAAEFPSVRILRSDTSLGYIRQRNRGARLARGRFLISIDDDAVLTTPHIARQVLSQFDHPRIGALAIPVWHVNSYPDIHQRPPSPEGRWITDSFIGTAYAVRRDLFVGLGGYREHFFHQGEERDFCLRLLAAGYVVRLANADHINHLESPRRSFTRIDRYGRRNDILFAWHNLPASVLPLALAKYTVSGIRHGLRVGRTWNMLLGLAMGYREILRHASGRQPVPPAVWKLYRELRSPATLEAVLPQLPPAAPIPPTPDGDRLASASPNRA